MPRKFKLEFIHVECFQIQPKNSVISAHLHRIHILYVIQNVAAYSHIRHGILATITTVASPCDGWGKRFRNQHFTNDFIAKNIMNNSAIFISV